MTDFSNPEEAAAFAKRTAVNRAMSILNALGAKYLIKLGDERYGDLVEHVPVPAAPARSKRVVKNNFRDTGYIDKIKAMKVGESLILKIAPELVKDFRGACSGSVAKVHGPGNCMTQTLPDGVCIVRIE